MTTGVSNFSERYPTLAKEWDFEANGMRSIDEVRLVDKTYAYWRCLNCDYKWRATVGKRRQGQGCQPCGRSRAAKKRILTYIAKHGSLESKFPEVAKEWHPTLNGELLPSYVTPNSNKEVWWLCPKGHPYPQIVDNRTAKGVKCSVCSGHRRIAGVNDIPTLFPTLALEWDDNNDRLPTDLDLRDNEFLQWKCKECDHRWTASLANRKKGRGCPACARRSLPSKKNTTKIKNGASLSETFPFLAKEWYFKLNFPLTPDEVTYGSKKKVWWVCSKCDFEWKATIDNRARGRGCRKCSFSSSSLETRALETLQRITDEKILVNSFPIKDNGARRQLDLYIPSLRIAFEVQDFATHDKESDNVPATFRGKSGLKKGPTYHERKRVLAWEQLSVKLIDIWQDEIFSDSLEETLRAAIRKHEVSEDNS